MKYAVRYYTKTGNTKRLAEAIAGELGVEALPISSPVTESVDYLFLGNWKPDWMRKGLHITEDDFSWMGLCSRGSIPFCC